ncbi:Rho guanine nucleotide exchange factor 28 [Cichlidogyrus casuarinus]|uniref:Rho guanine nucleotide exchange factor 28 n=1 Tax=Cichlidogyrus casuarinus TaxID=1844966 RepID=A0ABD2PSX3_9PLAT
MTELTNQEKLQNFSNHFVLRSSLSEACSLQYTEQENWLAETLKNPNTRLINYDKLGFITKCNGKNVTHEIHGLMLDKCFAMLQDVPQQRKYQLFRFAEKHCDKVRDPNPICEYSSLLKWGEVFGHFRQLGGKLLEFYLLVYGDKVEPFMYNFSCNKEYVDNLETIDKKWDDTQLVLDQLSKLDRCVLDALASREKFIKPFVFSLDASSCKNGSTYLNNEATRRASTNLARSQSSLPAAGRPNLTGSGSRGHWNKSLSTHSSQSDKDNMASGSNNSPSEREASLMDEGNNAIRTLIEHGKFSVIKPSISHVLHLFN